MLCTISRFVGGENTVIKILPMINKLLRDENYEIKVKFLAKVHEFNQSLGNDKIQIFAIPLL